MTGLDALAYRLRAAAGDAEGALVLFHGRGADEHDLFPLLDLLDPDRRLVGATPRGPLSLPPGGAHWYVVREIGYPDRQTFDASFSRASAWLEAFADETGIPPQRTILGGFSQGAVMTYSLGLSAKASLATPPERPRDSLARPLNAVQMPSPSANAAADWDKRPRTAGLIALSGFIPTVEGVELDLSAPPPTAIGHGTYDPVISVEWSRRAREQLEAAGANVLYREYPLPHAIDPHYVVELAAWLAALQATMRASTAE